MTQERCFRGDGRQVDFDEIGSLRKRSPAWRLLRADNAPLMLSFFEKVFVEGNARSVPGPDLAGRLDDELYALNTRLGAGTFPRPAQAYLDDWAAPEAGWLRKYYPGGSDEPHFDATPAVEKALSWVRGLRTRAFVGTESRLNTVVSLLRQMAHGAETDPRARLAVLRRERDEIDAEMARVQAGDIEVPDASAQRDRYQQFSVTARELLADFREVEANFRDLDRELREQIAVWNGSKGELLDEVLGSREAIADSDQGKSFQAFYDYLLSHARQDELTELIERVQRLDAIADSDPRIRRIHYDWLDAAERTQATVRQLSEQLRRFLDDQVWFENRRVIDILCSIEASALKLREDRGVTRLSTQIDSTSPTIVLPMERPLYRPVAGAAIDSTSVRPGEDGFDAPALFDQVHIDPARLALAVRRALVHRPRVGLAQLISEQPLEHGLAELMTYLSLSGPGFRVVFDEAARQQLSWQDEDGRLRSADLPGITFARNSAPDLPNGALP